MKDKKAAKKIIRLAKEHPDWYTEQDVFFAKMVKKRIKQEYSEKEYWEGKVPDDQFEEYLRKYGYEYTPTDYHKIPSRY